jgi:hypothetical protein
MSRREAAGHWKVNGLVQAAVAATLKQPADASSSMSYVTYLFDLCACTAGSGSHAGAALHCSNVLLCQQGIAVYPLVGCCCPLFETVM